jgi:hypothetical protein
LAGYFWVGLVVAYALSRGKGPAVATSLFLLVAAFAFVPLAMHSILRADKESIDLRMVVAAIIAGSLVLASYGLFRALSAWNRTLSQDRPMSLWRSVTIVFLGQLAFLVPLKILLQWTVGLKYFVFVPEHWVNI